MKFTAKEIEKIDKTKSFLRQVKQSDERIKSHFAELCRLHELKYSIGISIKTDRQGSVSCSSRTQHSQTDASFVDVIAKIDALEQKIESETEELAEVRKRVYDVIETAYSSDAKSVLWYIYIDGMTIERIAEKMNFSARHIRRIHKRALISVKIA